MVAQKLLCQCPVCGSSHTIHISPRELDETNQGNSGIRGIIVDPAACGHSFVVYVDDSGKSRGSMEVTSVPPRKITPGTSWIQCQCPECGQNRRLVLEKPLYESPRNERVFVPTSNQCPHAFLLYLGDHGRVQGRESIHSIISQQVLPLKAEN